MRALIAEDERGARITLRRILEQIGVAADEVENGLELLGRLEDPACNADFAIIDIEMPVLDGVATLRAIRASPRHHSMPVVCVSGVNDQAVIAELVGLGVSDFLLKPIRPEMAIPRLRQVIKVAGRWRERGSVGTPSDLLLVDPDPNFLAFAAPILAKTFSVVESWSGTKAAALFQQRRPAPGIVLVAEGLPLLSETQLVETLRRLAVQIEVGVPDVYLMSPAPDSVAPGKAAVFQGVLARSFVPEEFLAAFRRTVLKSVPPFDKLSTLLAGELKPEVISATQATIGVLVGQEVFRLPAEETAELLLPIRSTMTVGGAESGVSLEISLLSDAASVIRLSAKMLGRELSIEEGAADVLNELTNTLAGRIRSSLISRGLDLTMGLPQRFTDEPARPSTEWADPIAFRSGSGDRFLVGFRVLP